MIRQLFNMKMRETDPATFHINTFSRVLSELSLQGINFEEEAKALALLSSLPASLEVFYTTFATSCPKLNMDDNPSSSHRGHLAKIDGHYHRWLGRSPTTQPQRSIRSSIRENKSREPVETPVDQEFGKTDNGRSREEVALVLSPLTAESPTTMFPTGGQWRGRRTVDNSSGILDDPTQTILPKETKSMLSTLAQEKSYL